MRQLRYTLELPDGSHREHPAVPYAEAERLVRGMDWSAAGAPDRPAETAGPADGNAPFLLFLDEGESFFMIHPEAHGVQVTTQVSDKWNLMGFLSKQKAFTLEFGILSLEDALVLLKLFFEDNYPALRALEKELGWDSQGRD